MIRSNVQRSSIAYIHFFFAVQHQWAPHIWQLSAFQERKKHTHTHKLCFFAVLTIQFTTIANEPHIPSNNNQLEESLL